jgi:hypothetical protein
MFPATKAPFVPYVPAKDLEATHPRTAFHLHHLLDANVHLFLGTESLGFGEPRP